MSLDLQPPPGEKHTSQIIDGAAWEGWDAGLASNIAPGQTRNLVKITPETTPKMNRDKMAADDFLLDTL